MKAKILKRIGVGVIIVGAIFGILQAFIITNKQEGASSDCGGASPGPGTICMQVVVPGQISRGFPIQYTQDCHSGIDQCKGEFDKESLPTMIANFIICMLPGIMILSILSTLSILRTRQKHANHGN